MAAGCAGSHHPATVGSEPATYAPTLSVPAPSMTTRSTTTLATTPRPRARPRPRPPFAVAERTFTFVDHSRSVHYPGEPLQPRKLVILVWYPAAQSAGPFPLVVFGHGFAVTPGIYSALLRHWAAVGYVVAAPVFPLGNADAPGGPNETDLVNQPRDMSFVISRMLAIGGGALAGTIDARRIAVSGQSDGGDTALSAAYNARFRDRRIGAAVILSGEEIPGVGGYDFPAPAPALLAVQGLADTINPPSFTYAFFAAARPPKYLLTLPGAPHLGPYTNQQPQLGIVERVTTAFLDLYLKRIAGARRRMLAAGRVPGTASLTTGS